MEGEGAFSGSNHFTFHLSPRLCPSPAGCSPPSVPSIVLCLLLSCSKWFPPSLLCHLAIFSLISSLSLVATLYSVWSIYCPSFLLDVRGISRWSFINVLTFGTLVVLLPQVSAKTGWPNCLHTMSVCREEGEGE